MVAIAPEIRTRQYSPASTRQLKVSKSLVLPGVLDPSADTAFSVDRFRGPGRAILTSPRENDMGKVA